ncbi:prominin-1-A-like [Mya arenaria]|uniref:prominin-1-A-like n=1 Tax=Mya arenaria TaxID=6604 RepID=UPI0022DEA60A|nr:prominin-1-A-like [Mya arenaria]
MPVSFCKMLSCCAALILLSTLTSSVNVIETELEPLPTDANYKAGETNYDNGGMGPLYDFSRSFINSALPEFPTDFIKSVMDDGIGYVTSDPTGVIKKFAGYAIAIVIGLLFVLIMPIVGCCFCCCRMCGNCGGKREQEADDNMHCKRRVFSAILFTTTIFIFVGNICTYVANDQMSNALEGVNDIVGNNLDDVDTFLDLLESQVTTIGETNMNKTRDAIVDKMNATRMADDLSLYVLDELSDGALDQMNTNKERVIQAYKSFKTENARLKAAVPPLTPNPFATVEASLGTTDTSIKKFTDNDPIAQVKADLVTDMETKLKSSLTTQKTDVTDAFGKMSEQTKTIVDQIKGLREDAKGSLNVASIKDTVRSYTDSGKTFDGYRRKAGLGLSAMTTLVAALLALGMVFGTVGQGLRTEPTERGSVSSCGGHFLIAGVAFVFIFSSLLMLLTTLCFALGAPLERFLCQPLTDPDMKLLKEFETRDSFKSVADTLGGSITSSLKACKDGKSAYEAFHLEKRFNLTQIDTIFQDQKAKIDKSLDDTLKSITGATNAGNLEAKASTSFNDLETTFVSLPWSSMNTAVTKSQGVGLDMSGFKAAVDELKAIQVEIPTWKTNFTKGMKKAQDDITAQLPRLVGKFKNEVIHIAEVFVTSTKKSLLEDVGKCTPVWNLYHSIIGVAVCQYIIDAFNGFWFSIGWCLFFFVPSLIFAVKLAKHYRSVDPEDQPFENKVGPSPDEVEARY